MSTHLLIQIKIRAEAVIAGLQRFTSGLQAATQASLLRVAQDGFYIYLHTDIDKKYKKKSLFFLKICNFVLLLIFFDFDINIIL
jgi:hypothetical protein